MAILKKLKRDDKGGAAIEFGLVAAPFFGLLFAIMELALVFLTNQVLDQAVTNASRQIFTGRTQSAGGNADSFKQAICAELPVLIPCSRLSVDVRLYSDFAAANNSGTINNPTNQMNSFTGYNPGSGNDFIVVRAGYSYPIIFAKYLPGMVDNSSADGSSSVILSVRSFRNEPFDGTTSNASSGTSGSGTSGSGTSGSGTSGSGTSGSGTSGSGTSGSGTSGSGTSGSGTSVNQTSTGVGTSGSGTSTK